MSSKEYYSSEYHSEYYYSDSDSTSAPESEYEYDYDYLEPSNTAPAPRAATDYQKRKQAHQISPSIKGTVDLWENRIAREGPNAIIAPLKVPKSYGKYRTTKRSATDRSPVCRFESRRLRRVLPKTTTYSYRYYVIDAFCAICNPTAVRVIINRMKEKWILTLGYLLSILILLSFPECSTRRSYDFPRGSKLDWPFETLLLYVWTTDWFSPTGTVAINNCTEVYTIPLTALLTFAFGTLILI